MAQHPAFYSVSLASVGCLPDALPYAVACYSRRDLVAAVNNALRYAGFSDRARRQVDLVALWRRIQFARSASCAHFTIDDTAPGSLYQLAFHGLTAAEFDAMCDTDD